MTKPTMTNHDYESSKVEAKDGSAESRSLKLDNYVALGTECGALAKFDCFRTLNWFSTNDQALKQPPITDSRIHGVAEWWWWWSCGVAEFIQRTDRARVYKSQMLQVVWI
jgi:hypothetical protein